MGVVISFLQENLTLPGRWTRVSDSEVKALEKGVLVAIEDDGVVLMGTFSGERFGSVYLSTVEGKRRLAGRLPDAAVYVPKVGG